MIVLSSFSISSAINISPVSLTLTDEAQIQLNTAINNLSVNYDSIVAFQVGDTNTIQILAFNKNSAPQFLHLDEQNGKYYITNDELFLYASAYSQVYIDSNTTVEPSIYSGISPAVSTLKFVYSNQYIYDTSYVNKSNLGNISFAPINYEVNISIKPSQRILFNYVPADKDKFLKSLSCTPDKSITVHQAYYSGGQVTDMVIKKDTTDLLIGGAPLTLASFPSHRVLNTNEYLGYSQANGGNWVWTDYIPGSSGGPVGTDSNSLVTFTIDTRYCSYRIVSANTGLEITSGGIADVPQVPDDGIYNNNQNPWGPGDITDDYLLDRADYEDGIIGDIQYGFDTLFKFLKMPFELLYKFIMTLGEIIQYALGTVSGFTTALQGIYAILPSPIWFLVIMAISINVFKLIFGR